jgi:hypothetical protein
MSTALSHTSRWNRGIATGFAIALATASCTFYPFGKAERERPAEPQIAHRASGHHTAPHRPADTAEHAKPGSASVSR